MKKQDEKSYQFFGILLVVIAVIGIVFTSGGTFKMPTISQQSIEPSMKILVDENATGPIDVIIFLNPPGAGIQTQDLFIQDIETMGGTVSGSISSLDNAVFAMLDASKLETLAMNPTVGQIIPNRNVWFAPQETGTVGTQSADNRYDFLNVRQLWSQGYTGKGVTVAVVDTGINSGLSIFQRDGKSIITDRFSTYGAEYTYWHGTAVASCIASQDASVKGIAYDVNLLNVCVFSGTSATMKDVMRGWDYVKSWKLSHKSTPLICVNSIGADPRITPDALRLNAYASQLVANDITMVVASGNGGPGVVFCPGASKDVLTVGAVDFNGNLASFSCYDNSKPDVVAPGVDVPMFDSSGMRVTKSGTSFSTPLTAGVAALILQENPGYSAYQVQQAIKLGARDKQGAGYGAGYVDAQGATNQIATIPPAQSYDTLLPILAIVGIAIVAIPMLKKRKK
jgi:subtilisin family serine protease